MRLLSFCFTTTLLFSAPSWASDDSRAEYPATETRKILLINSATVGIRGSKNLEATLVRFESSDETLSSAAKVALPAQEAAQLRKSLEFARSLVERSQEPLNEGQLEVDVFTLRTLRKSIEAKISTAIAPPKSAPAKPSPKTPATKAVIDPDLIELKRGPGHLYMGP